jgi:hypothetical protein
MSWETGSERIREPVNAGESGQVPPDTGLARRMLADARRHLATATAAESADQSGSGSGSVCPVPRTPMRLWTG